MPDNAPADKTVQALNLQLQMDTALVLEALKTLENSATQFTDNLNKKLPGAFAQATKVLTEHTAIIDALEKNSTATVADIEKAVDIQKDLNKQLKISEDSDIAEAKFWEEYKKSLKIIQKDLTLKNKLHEEENDLVEKELDTHEKMGEIGKEKNKDLKKTAITWRDIENATFRMMQYLKQTDAIAENFVTTNYRAYGTQSLLAQETRATAMEFGILHDQAAEAMQVVMNMKIPKEELEGYVITLAKANRYTGIATKSLGDHAFRMRQVGMNAEDMEKRYNRLGEVMRKFKLTTEDMSRVMADSSWSPAMASILFGDDEGGQKGIEKYEDMKAAMVGLGAMAGQTADDVVGMMENFQTFDNMALLEQFGPNGQIRAGVKGAEDYAFALDHLAAKALAVEKETRAMGGSQAAVIAKLQQEGLAAGLVDAKQLLLLATLKKVAKERGLSIAQMGELKEATDLYNEANMTLTQQLKVFGSNIFSLIGTVLEPLRWVLMNINHYMNEWGKVIGENLKEFRKWWMETEAAEGALGKFLWAVRGGFGIILGLGMLLIMVGASITGVVAACGNFKFIGAGILRLAVAIKALGKALIPLARAALEFGIGVLAAGAGAWLFAEACQTLVNIMQKTDTGARDLAIAIGILVIAMVALGWGAVALATALSSAINILATGIVTALGTVTTGLYFAMGVLATMAPVCMTALPAILIIGGALLVLAFSALMLGWAIESVGKGFLAMGEGVLAAGKGMLLLGKGLLLVAENNLYPWQWVALGLGLTTIAVAAGEAAPNMRKFAEAFKEMTSENVVKLAEGMKGLAEAMKVLVPVAGMASSLEKLATIGPALTALVASLKDAGSNLQLVAPNFIAISEALRQLSTVLKEFGAQATTLRAIGDNFVAFAQSMLVSGSMLRLAFSQFGWLSLVRIVGFLQLMTEALEAYATRLIVASEKFSKPAIQLVASFTNLNNAVNSFEGLGDRLAINLNKLIAPLEAFAGRLSTASDTLSGSTAKLTGALTGLADAVANFGGIGDGLSLNLENLIAPLDAYTAQLEATATRMDAAINDKLLPAMRAAQQAGAEAIRAEAINNVEVMPTRAEDKNQIRTVALLEKQNQLLETLTEIIGKFDTAEVAKIRQMMEDQQGQLADVVPNLSSELNGWA